MLAVFNDFGTLAITGPSLLSFIEGTVNQRITETSTWRYCSSGVSASFLVRRGESGGEVMCEVGESGGEVMCEGVP